MEAELELLHCHGYGRRKHATSGGETLPWMIKAGLQCFLAWRTMPSRRRVANF